jgi:hypothetical protein
LEGAKSAFFCLGCGSAEKTLLLPLAEVLKRRNEMSRSARGHWHFVVDVIEEKLEFRPIGQGHRSDLSEYVVPIRNT